MEIEFWAERWKEGRIGFHEGRPNGFLARHVDRLGAANGSNLLVPLCGKAEDVAFLAARGFRVVGIEVVEDAVKAFFEEHKLTPTVSTRAHGRVYEGAGITIHCADFFACTTEVLGSTFDAFYDRAAIVALPEEMRARYARHLRTLVTPKARALVITFEYEDGEFKPPPFSVSEAEIHALYKGVTVESIDSGPADGPRFREANVIPTERVYALQF